MYDTKFYFYYSRISHFGAGLNNRSRKKTGGGGGETAEDEVMLVDSSS